MPEPQASIGMAQLDEEGNIVMTLRALSDDGHFGEATLVIPPYDDRYDSILAHLGGLEPGDIKPVPPFPDDG